MQSLLFDLDGTLLDHFTCLARCYEHVLTDLHQPIPARDQVRRAVGGSVELTMAKFVPEELHKEACARWKEYLKEILCEDAYLMPGALSLIQALKAQGNQLAVFTNKVGVHSRTLCDHLEISQYMDAVVGADDTPYRKPQKEFSEHVLKILNANPETTVLIGDSPFDIQAAHAIGIPAHCVITGTHSAEELIEAKADGVYPDLPTLGKTLFNLDLLTEFA
ncbi:MAG: HAD family hydrolase [Verrucomicrobia bacterium]|nr:HAD family hydrolase [Verrucomicrobiota bacterium]